MFNSISNNFGAGTIQFKEARESNYLVLNAKFTYNTTNADYLAADTLEITVPDLPFERSAVAGAFMRFVDRGTKSGYPYISDGGTVLKTWIKDKNTICIEKLTAFDAHEEMIIYIQTLYCQLAQGTNAAKAATTSLVFKQAVRRISMSSNNVCIIFDKWVFLHLDISGISYSYTKADIKVAMNGFPLDVDVEMPLAMTSCSQTPKAGGVNVITVKDGCFFTYNGERNDGFSNTANYVFAFGYLVRDRDIPEDVSNRYHIAENPMKGTGTVQMSGFELEFQALQFVVSINGSTGQYGKSYCILYPKTILSGLSKFTAYVYGRYLNGSGLCIQLDTLSYTYSDGSAVIRFDNVSGGNALAAKFFDTGAALQI